MFLGRIDIPTRSIMHPEMRRCMLAAGGIAMITSANKESFEEWKNALPRVCRGHDLTPDTVFVFVMEKARKCLTEDELTAILIHEEGHYVLGHLNTDKSGIINDINLEFAADDFAADKLGSVKSLISALKKIFDFVIQYCIPKLMGVRRIPRDLITFVLDAMNLILRQRIDRLEAHVFTTN